MILCGVTKTAGLQCRNVITCFRLWLLRDLTGLIAQAFRTNVCTHMSRLCAGIDQIALSLLRDGYCLGGVLLVYFEVFVWRLAAPHTLNDAHSSSLCALAEIWRPNWPHSLSTKGSEENRCLATVVTFS